MKKFCIAVLLITVLVLTSCAGSLVRPVATSEPELVQTDVSKTDPTPTSEAEAPAPTATSEADTPVEATWPTNPEEAARLFGSEASRWEITPDGGWHLTEDHSRTLINPSGFVLEGYYDQAPGKDPRAFVSTVAIELQGCTIWPLKPSEAQTLFDAMASQKRYTATQADEFIDKVGW